MRDISLEQHINGKGSNMPVNFKLSALISRFNKMKLSPGFSKRTFWIALLVALVVIGSGSMIYYKYAYLPDQKVDEPAMQTAIVHQGDLVIYASGTGTLIAADEVDLAFKTGGQVMGVFIKVGDEVNTGDLLAQVDDTSAQINYTLAKRSLLELTSATAVATAQQEMAQASIDLGDAMNHLEYIISPTLLHWEEQVSEAEQALQAAQAKAEASPSDIEVQKNLEKAKAYLEYAKANLVSAQYSYKNYYVPNTFTVKEYNRATRTWVKYVSAPSEAEILDARAAVNMAKASLIETEYLYTALTGGEVPEDATGSGLSDLEQAKLDLESAQNELDGTRIYAPISGTVMAVDTRVGDTVSSSTTVITVADLSQAYLEVFLDETDWANIKAGYDVDVIFDILPDKTFTGRVSQVDPGLYTEYDSAVVRALVKLDSVDGSLDLPLGTNAGVDVIGGEALKAVLVPIEALHETSPGEYAVFVVENGKPRLRLVEVGIKDLLYAEIKSGLKVGEVVTTGITEIK